jgi:hypothetical protein
MYFGVLSLHSALVYEKLNEMLFDLLQDNSISETTTPNTKINNFHEETQLILIYQIHLILEILLEFSKTEEYIPTFLKNSGLISKQSLNKEYWL